MQAACPIVRLETTDAASNRFTDIKLFSHMTNGGKNDRFTLSRADIIAIRPVFLYLYPRSRDVKFYFKLL